MSRDTPTDALMAPADWPAEPERRYASLQARFAADYGLDVESHVIDTDAVGRVHYLAAGDPAGEPVVLLHGFSAPAAVWLPLAPALADGYRLYAPDTPGEGLSAKPSFHGRELRSFLVGFLRELLDALGLDRPHVVANSLGGWQAFLLAIDHDRVDRLCLLGAPVGVSRRFPWPVRLLTVSGLNRFLLWAETRGDPVEHARSWVRRFAVVDPAAVPDAFYDLYAARQALPGLQRSLRTFMDEVGSFGRISPLADLRDEIAGIERPTTFVWGAEDYYWPPDVGRRVADRMADAEFHALDDHGHGPWLEPGDEAERLVRAFLDG